MQSASEIGNPPEMVFEQESDDANISIKADKAFISNFLLDPATIVFFDDLAAEYGIVDHPFFGAMINTIIYREVAMPDSLEFAGMPNRQRIYEALEANVQSVGYFVAEILRKLGVEIGENLDGDPSAGIGGLSSKAVHKIHDDAKRLGITLYFPHLGFDLSRCIENSATIVQESPVFRIGGSMLPQQVYSPQVIPPSNDEYGVGRSVIPRFADRGLRGWRERHEPTLGYIAAEVAIAMQKTEYQELQTEEERIAFLIAYHAYRSATPEARLFAPDEFSEDTYEEIQWARDFLALTDEIRTQIQSRAQSK